MSQPFASSWKDLGKLSERLESEDKKNGIAICGPRPSRRGSDRATWNRALEAIVPLPETVRTQPSHDYTYGSRMMALNPDTTCLYRATIVSGGRCLVIVETPASLAAHLLVTNPDAKAQGAVIAYDGRHGSKNPMETDETFGPLAALFKSTSEEDVLELTNDSDVGLAGYIFSRDYARCWPVAEALQVGMVGMVGINCPILPQNCVPFGGVKESGFGRGAHYGRFPSTHQPSLCISPSVTFKRSLA
ncbi:hypothetical protein CF336_g6030 [Tilletia laevis]|nr:hypothetical protein CF336_g6030 [Tilletia laevis]